MRLHERTRALVRSPVLLAEILGRGRYQFTYDRMPITLRGMRWRKRVNLLKSGANIGVRRARPWGMPLHMQFELTNYCGLRCRICPTGIRALGRPPKAMTPELFARVFEEVGPYLLTASLWGWGEPNLHPELAEILRISGRHRVATLLSTNGQNLSDDRVIDAIAAFPPTFLIVAIDGLTDETNRQFRAGAKLEPALEGVRRLAAIRAARGRQWPVLHMRFIVMKHNQHEVPDLVDFAHDHGFDLLTVRTLSLIDHDETLAVHEEMVPDDDDLRAYGYEERRRVRRDDFYCTNPFWFPSVFADGTVVACEQDYGGRLPLGKVQNGTTFQDVWYDTAAREARRRIRDRPDELSFCGNCPFRDRETTDVSVAAHFINPGIDYDRLLVNGAVPDGVRE